MSAAAVAASLLLVAEDGAERCLNNPNDKALQAFSKLAK